MIEKIGVLVEGLGLFLFAICIITICYRVIIYSMDPATILGLFVMAGIGLVIITFGAIMKGEMNE